MSDVVATVVERFRDAALGLCGWDEALGLIGQAAGSHMMQLGGLGVTDHALVLNHTCGISADKMGAYFDARGFDPAINPRTRGFLHFTPFRCFTDDDALTGSEQRDFAIYHDLFRPTEADHAALIRLGNVHGIDTGLTLMRSRGFGGFERPTLDLIEHAAPGIASAVFAAVALGAGHERSVVTTAEALGGVAILLGIDRVIVSLSPATEAVLRNGRGLTVRSGRLAAIDPADDQALERAFRLAGLPNAPEARQSRLALTTLDGTMTLDLCPLPRRMAGPIAPARVLLTMPLTTPDRDIALVGAAETFGLTPAESAVAALLASGCTPRQIAERRGSAISTVRGQLKMLFEKTGTHRQTELVMLLGSGSRS